MSEGPGNITPTRFRARAIQTTPLSREVLGVLLAAPPGWRFRAGQYLKVFLPGGGAKPPARYYSIASEPARLPQMEIAIKASNDEAARRFWEGIHPGDEIEIEGPNGSFAICGGSTKPKLFVAMGTGIAPLRSILRDLLLDVGLESPISLYFGLRKEDDRIFFGEFEDLARHYPRFRFVPTLSHPSGDWKGEKGRVSELLARDFPSAKDLDAYVCGSLAMVDETLQLLISRGLDPAHAHREKF